MSSSTEPAPPAVMVVTSTVRPGVAVFIGLCAAVTAIGGLLPWVAASGDRPAMGMTGTSLLEMLVFSLDDTATYWASVGFTVLVLGLLIALGAALGLRTLVVIASLLAIAAGGMWIGLVEHTFTDPDAPNAHWLNPANLPWADLRLGAWMTLGGALLALISAFLLRRQPVAAA